MGKFFVVWLERNDANASYEGVVYDRILTVRLPNDRLLSVFDSQAISTDLQAGEQYEMLLQPLMPVTARSSATYPHNVSVEDWVGQVTELHWQASNHTYRCAAIRFYEQTWVLLTTQLGQVLTTVGVIDGTPNIGDYIYWPETRFDLLAVV